MTLFSVAFGVFLFVVNIKWYDLEDAAQKMHDGVISDKLSKW